MLHVFANKCVDAVMTIFDKKKNREVMGEFPKWLTTKWKKKILA